MPTPKRENRTSILRKNGAHKRDFYFGFPKTYLSNTREKKKRKLKSKQRGECSKYVQVESNNYN